MDIVKIIELLFLECLKCFAKSLAYLASWVIAFKVIYKITGTSHLLDDICKWVKK